MEPTGDSTGSKQAPDRPRRGTRRAVLGAAVPPAAAALIAGTWALTRATFLRREIAERASADGQRFVMAFWHCKLFFMRYAHPHGPLAAMISSHDDGELIARTMALFGHDAMRGSSTRGGSRALREAIRLARAGYDLAVTPDGPRGPARVAKPGVVEIARVTGLPILPISLAFSRAWRARSWDRFEVPVPLGRAVFAYGELMECPRGADAVAREALCRYLERRLESLEAECVRELAAGKAAAP